MGSSSRPLVSRRSPSAPSPPPIARLTDTDWLDLGLELLRTKGPQALTIEELCRAAGKTKGAFYHRFAGTDGYRDALLAHWHEVVTVRVIDELGEPNASGHVPSQREALIQLSLGIDMDLERSIRSWGIHEPAVQTVVNATDNLRIATVARFARPRRSEEETLAAAATEYSMFLGFVLMQDPATLQLMLRWVPAVQVEFDPDYDPDATS